ncbi:uncharacterized protein LOC101845288 [Aplysia californica]|uniref:Uncharacterized protein LOC101845288 n=1 Tax=Aplysia californica TaxID=6500 RepID=A0ABM0K963_APLCA|nr:uncharacterized protein LOC101845288 [Aplysia californica]
MDRLVFWLILLSVAVSVSSMPTVPGIRVCKPALQEFKLSGGAEKFRLLSPNYDRQLPPDGEECTVTFGDSKETVMINVTFRVFSTQSGPDCSLCVGGVQLCGTQPEGKTFSYIVPPQMSFTFAFLPNKDSNSARFKANIEVQKYDGQAVEDYQDRGAFFVSPESSVKETEFQYSDSCSRLIYLESQDVQDSSKYSYSNIGEDIAQIQNELSIGKERVDEALALIDAKLQVFIYSGVNQYDNDIQSLEKIREDLVQTETNIRNAQALTEKDFNEESIAKCENLLTQAKRHVSQALKFMKALTSSYEVNYSSSENDKRSSDEDDVKNNDDCYGGDEGSRNIKTLLEKADKNFDNALEILNSLSNQYTADCDNSQNDESDGSVSEEEQPSLTQRRLEIARRQLNKALKSITSIVDYYTNLGDCKEHANDLEQVKDQLIESRNKINDALEILRSQPDPYAIEYAGDNPAIEKLRDIFITARNNISKSRKIIQALEALGRKDFPANLLKNALKKATTNINAVLLSLNGQSTRDSEEDDSPDNAYNGSDQSVSLLETVVKRALDDIEKASECVVKMIDSYISANDYSNVYAGEVGELKRLSDQMENAKTKLYKIVEQISTLTDPYRFDHSSNTVLEEVSDVLKQAQQNVEKAQKIVDSFGDAYSFVYGGNDFPTEVLKSSLRRAEKNIKFGMLLMDKLSNPYGNVYQPTDLMFGFIHDRLMLSSYELHNALATINKMLDSYSASNEYSNVYSGNTVELERVRAQLEQAIKNIDTALCSFSDPYSFDYVSETDVIEKSTNVLQDAQSDITDALKVIDSIGKAYSSEYNTVYAGDNIPTDVLKESLNNARKSVNDAMRLMELFSSPSSYDGQEQQLMSLMRQLLNSALGELREVQKIVLNILEPYSSSNQYSNVYAGDISVLKRMAKPLRESRKIIKNALRIMLAESDPYSSFDIGKFKKMLLLARKNMNKVNKILNSLGDTYSNNYSSLYGGDVVPALAIKRMLRRTRIDINRAVELVAAIQNPYGNAYEAAFWENIDSQVTTVIREINYAVRLLRSYQTDKTVQLRVKNQLDAAEADIDSLLEALSTLAPDSYYSDDDKALENARKSLKDAKKQIREASKWMNVLTDPYVANGENSLNKVKISLRKASKDARAVKDAVADITNSYRGQD